MAGKNANNFFVLSVKVKRIFTIKCRVVVPIAIFKFYNFSNGVIMTTGGFNQIY